ncbi:MAG: hypothetical protein PWP09_1600 [Thermotogota bacterium]|nr:hypothetical protein [Thermotogota bacterium]
MFKSFRSFHTLKLVIEPETSLLIKSGDTPVDPTVPDMAFVRIPTPFGETVYIPGSSLKGVMRSHAAQLLAGVGKDICAISVANGDCGNKAVNGEKVMNIDSGVLRYQHSCHVCRTFGSTALASVVRVADFFPYPYDAPEEEKKKKISEISKMLGFKTGIKIDPKSGTVQSRALYTAEILSGGRFYGELVLKNPEIWQLGLIFKVIEDMNNGVVRLGHMSTRGLGKVKVTIEEVFVETTSSDGIAFTKFNGDFSQEILKVQAKPEIKGFISHYSFKENSLESLKETVYEKTSQALKR